MSFTSTTRQPPSVHFTQLFVNGAFVDSSTGATFGVIDPATEAEIARVSEASIQDVDAAVVAAHTAGSRGSAWRSLDPHQRGGFLAKLAALVERDADYIADLEALNTGKPAFMSRVVDSNTAVRMLTYYSGWPDKLTGSTYALADGGLGYTRYEPIGVVAAILPFNFPILGAITKAAPALAAGNTVIVKPAEQTPLTALYLASLVAEAGFPPGVFNVVNGPGETTGAALVAHPLVRKVTFTGSTTVGKIISRVCTDSMKRVTLELGGKNACIICPDADVDTAVKIASGGNYFNSGQICVGISRVFIPDSMYDEFVAKAVEKASKRTLGDQWSGCDQGPQACAEQRDRVLHYINLGIKEGARLVCGGGAGTASNEKGEGEGKGKGYYILPTIFADVTDDMTIAKEEIFGPVMCCMKYSTIEEAVRRANATEYGLAATVVTKDVSRALLIANALETGTVWINEHGRFDAAAPYGGFKQSGMGREYGLEGLLHFVETKTVFVSLPKSGEAIL